MNRITDRRVGAHGRQTVAARDDGQGQKRRRGTLPVSFAELASYVLIVVAMAIGTMLGVLVATLLWGRG